MDKLQYNEEDVKALERVSMLIDEYMCCDDDKLTDSGKNLRNQLRISIAYRRK